MHSSEKDYCYSHRVILQSNHQSNNSYYTTIELLLLRQSNTLANMKSNNSSFSSPKTHLRLFLSLSDDVMRRVAPNQITHAEGEGGEHVDDEEGQRQQDRGRGDYKVTFFNRRRKEGRREVQFCDEI